MKQFWSNDTKEWIKWFDERAGEVKILHSQLGDGVQDAVFTLTRAGTTILGSPHRARQIAAAGSCAHLISPTKARTLREGEYLPAGPLLVLLEDLPKRPTEKWHSFGRAITGKRVVIMVRRPLHL